MKHLLCLIENYPVLRFHDYFYVTTFSICSNCTLTPINYVQSNFEQIFVGQLSLATFYLQHAHELKKAWPNTFLLWRRGQVQVQAVVFIICIIFATTYIYFPIFNRCVGIGHIRCIVFHWHLQCFRSRTSTVLLQFFNRFMWIVFEDESWMFFWQFQLEEKRRNKKDEYMWKRNNISEIEWDVQIHIWVKWRKN